MRNIDSNFQSALNQSRDTGIVPRRFVYVTAKNRSDGTPVTVGFWNSDEDIALSVISATSGLPELRSYYGAINLEVAGIKRVSDLTVQTVEISISQIAAVAQQLVRGYDVRLAKVEIHEGLINPTTRLFVSPPFPVFLGEIDAAPITTPAVGEDGNITLNAVSDAISMLTRTNPKKSSYEAQKKRSNDQWGKYGSTVETWQIKWGSK